LVPNKAELDHHFNLVELLVPEVLLQVVHAHLVQGLLVLECRAREISQIMRSKEKIELMMKSAFLR
jgi:hypothetical protein